MSTDRHGTEIARQSMDETVPMPPRARRVELRPVTSLREAEPEAWVREPISRLRLWLFLVLFVLPVALSAVYWGLVASDVYVSEAKFIVRSTAKTDAAGISALVQSQGFSRSAEDTNVVAEYMVSRGMLNLLTREDGLRKIMNRPEADLFTRYPRFFGTDNEEFLYRAFQSMVSIETAEESGISVMTVEAVRADDAVRLARALLNKAEAFVNRMNIRANRDALAFAEQMEIEAKARMIDVENRLAEYRNREKVVDPAKETTETFAAITKLQTEISRLEATLAQQRAMAPESPAIPSLREKIASMKREFDARQSTIVGGIGSMASKLQGYEMLMIERDLVTRSVGAATSELEKARQDAASQRIYLQTVVEPNRPDQPLLPRRLLNILLVAVVSGIVFKIVTTIIDGIADHGT